MFICYQSDDVINEFIHDVIVQITISNGHPWTVLIIDCCESKTPKGILRAASERLFLAAL